MKQLIQSYRTGKIELVDMPVPMLKKGGVLVQTTRSLISVGTEKSMIQMGRKSILGKAYARPDLVKKAYDKAKKEGFINVFKESLNRLDEPVPLGYSSAGVAIESKTDSFKAGDRVACAGAGFASHAEFAWVPENLCLPIPDAVADEQAAFVMVGSIALEGVRCADLTFGENVAVIGLGLLGLISVQILKSYGCNVFGVDVSKDKVELAAAMGADACILVGEQDAESVIMDFTGGFGADAVIITAASQDSAPIYMAENISRQRGRIVLVGVADLKLTRKTFWEKELTFRVSKAAGPGSLDPRYEKNGVDYPLEHVRWTEKRNMAHFLDLMAKGSVNLERLITHRFRFEEALDAYNMIINNTEPFIGVMLEYDTTSAPVRRVTYRDATISKTTDLKATGIIGAGLFTKNILLPSLMKVPGISLKGISSTQGVTASHAAKKFGFDYCTSNYMDIMKDESIRTVIITTPHHLHAQMVAEGLAAGKNVFVEKPLAMEMAQLKKVMEAFRASDSASRFVVGFNRRYSPLAIDLKKRLESRTAPVVASYRVNAGYIPLDHWTQDPMVGGGRIIGEVCHFIDFLQFITGSVPATVSADAIAGEKGKYISSDNVNLSLSFQDGSIANILYCSQGSKSFSRERCEVFSGDSVYVIDDFRQMEYIAMGKKNKRKLSGQELGYQEELDFLYQENIDNYDMLLEGFLYTTVACFKAIESIQKSKRLDISIEEL